MINYKHKLLTIIKPCSLQPRRAKMHGIARLHVAGEGIILISVLTRLRVKLKRVNFNIWWRIWKKTMVIIHMITWRSLKRQNSHNPQGAAINLSHEKGNILLAVVFNFNCIGFWIKLSWIRIYILHICFTDNSALRKTISKFYCSTVGKAVLIPFHLNHIWRAPYNWVSSLFLVEEFQFYFTGNWKVGLLNMNEFKLIGVLGH